MNEAQLADAAQKFIRPGEIVWIVVGDIKTIEPGIRSLGFGEVIRLNAEGEEIK